MQRKYNKYTDWEDFKNGMFDTIVENPEGIIKLAFDLLSDKELFYISALNMVNAWEVSASENLTNTHSNRRSWIGQATCCYIHCVPETLTRIAWGKLSTQQRNEANFKADKVIRIYEENYRRIHKDLGEQSLF
mgnify:FL=1